MSKKKLIIILVSAVLLLAAVGALFVFRGYFSAYSAMPKDGRLTAVKMADGSVKLKWLAAENADEYRVVLSSGGLSKACNETVTETGCTLPPLALGSTYTISVTPLREYKTVFGTFQRGGAGIKEKCDFDVPVVTDLRVVTDADAKTSSFTWTAESGISYGLCTVEGQVYTFIKYNALSGVQISFGEGGDASVPTVDAPAVFAVSGCKSVGRLDIYGTPSEAVAVSREDLLGRVLTLKCETLGNNQFLLSWNETKGEHYEVQYANATGESWLTAAFINQGDELKYTTEHLEPFSQIRVRVVAVGGQTLDGSQYATEPAEAELTTEASSIFATIWPLGDRELYSDTTRETVISTVPGGTMLCVLDETDGLFQVRYGDSTGYLDSSYCLINLPDYMGALCSYDITNSYSSLYMIHEYGIANVSGTVISGYQNVKLGDGSYLVPFLYPCAKKLVTAALCARDAGYRLKIYDSYRPNCATLSIYDRTAAILENPLPSYTFSGKAVYDLPAPPEDDVLRYVNLVCNDTYDLGYFLARGGSLHNMGIALDMTLEELSTGQELAMQTSMHDLTYYSVIYRNNDNANLFAGFMKNAGFGDLISEWWHFQDNDTKAELKLSTFMYTGVSAEGWVCDDTGWRYRLADGSFVSGIAQTIDGVEYSFDAAGYVISA